MGKMPNLCSLAYLAGFVNDGGRMNKIIGLSAGHGLGLPVFPYGLAASLEDSENVETVFTVGLGRLSLLDAFDEVLALIAKRLFLRQGNHLSLRAPRNRQAIHPVYSMWIKHQLSFRFRVIEDRHGAVTYDNQLLLFEGV